MRIIITESQYKLIVESKEYFEQLKDLLINNNFELAEILAKSLEINLDEVIKELVITNYTASGFFLYSNFTFDVYDIIVSNKRIEFFTTNLYGIYFDEEGKKIYDINEFKEESFQMSDFIDRTMLESIMYKFPFVKNYGLNLKYNSEI
jgi:hypothetical protein